MTDEQNDETPPTPQHPQDAQPTNPAGAPVRATPRDYLANERTLLAWVRTGVALIGLGFVVARFGFVLRELAGVTGPHLNPSFLSSLVGAGILLLAAAMLALSFQRYRAIAQALTRGAFADTQRLTALLTMAVIAIALLLSVYLLMTSG